MPPLTRLGRLAERERPGRDVQSSMQDQVALGALALTQSCQGSILSASLAPRSWHEPPGRTSTKPTPLPGMLDEPTALFLLHLEWKSHQPVARLEQVRSERRLTVR